MSETELISIFDINIKEFLSSLESITPSHKKKIKELQSELDSGIVVIISEFNKSVKKYEKRFLDKDITVLYRINNVIFARLGMYKLISKLKEPDQINVWNYLKCLYMYSEFIENPKRPDMQEIITKCSPPKEKSTGDSLDLKIDQATKVLGNMFGDNEGFRELIKEVGSQVGTQIKQNNGELDTQKIMESFGKMMKGEEFDQNIGGIDMASIINNTSKKLEKQIESGELDPNKLRETISNYVSKK